MNKYSFYIRVFPNGDQYISSFFQNKGIESLALILHQIGSNNNQLYSLKLRIIEAIDMRTRFLVNYNTLYIYVDGDKSEIGENDYKPSDFQKVPTALILNFIDDTMKFNNLYNSGGVPGIIPESKKEEWMIVPKEFVKEDFYNSQS